MADPERIYLQPECCSDPLEGRCWASSLDDFEDCDGEHEPTQYVRADLVQQPDMLISPETVEKLQKVAAAARLVSEMSSYDEDEDAVDPCHMVYFEELEAALQALSS